MPMLRCNSRKNSAACFDVFRGRLKAQAYADTLMPNRFIFIIQHI